MVEYVHIYILQGEAGMCTKDVERRKAVNLKIEKIPVISYRFYQIIVAEVSS